MSIDIKYPVFLCGENPGLTLYKLDTDQPVAIASYWHVTYSPYGVGNALVLWLDAVVSPAPGGIFTDNIPLAQILIEKLTRHFPEFSDVPVTALPYHEAHCGHVFNGVDRYTVTCNSEGTRIVVEWADLLDRKSLSWTQFPTGSQSFDLHNVICPCNSGTISINDKLVEGVIKTRILPDGHQSSTAFLAFAESWVGPLEAPP